MHTELNRRDVLKTIGGAGLAAVFGARALDFLGEDAQAATTCLLTPEATEGPYWVENSVTRRDIRAAPLFAGLRSLLDIYPPVCVQIVDAFREGPYLGAPVPHVNAWGRDSCFSLD